MKVYFAADHAGFTLKNELLNFVRGELGADTQDCGAYELDQTDDYPEIIAKAARKLSSDAAKGLDSRAILIGASGQGEAIVANRFPHVRAALYYGDTHNQQTDAAGTNLDMIASTREHNDTNALSLGARFITIEEAKAAVKVWITTPFRKDERHAKRIASIEALR